LPRAKNVASVKSLDKNRSALFQGKKTFSIDVFLHTLFSFRQMNFLKWERLKLDYRFETKFYSKVGGHPCSSHQAYLCMCLPSNTPVQNATQTIYYLP
jgi:hypothetical protein